MSRIVIWIFALAYLASLCLLAIGSFGWFGQPKDGLSGVYLIMLGWPWSTMGGGLLMGLIAPGINLAILMLICRLVTRRG